MQVVLFSDQRLLQMVAWSRTRTMIASCALEVLSGSGFFLLKAKSFLYEQRSCTCFDKVFTITPNKRYGGLCTPKHSTAKPGVCDSLSHSSEAQWPIGYGVGLRIERSSVRIRPWPLRWVLEQGSSLPLSQGEAFTLACISYLAILVKYILAKWLVFVTTTRSARSRYDSFGSTRAAKKVHVRCMRNRDLCSLRALFLRAARCRASHHESPPTVRRLANLRLFWRFPRLRC